MNCSPYSRKRNNFNPWISLTTQNWLILLLMASWFYRLKTMNKVWRSMKTEDIFVWQLFPLNSISKTRRRKKYQQVYSSDLFLEQGWMNVIPLTRIRPYESQFIESQWKHAVFRMKMPTVRDSATSLMSCFSCLQSVDLMGGSIFPKIGNYKKKKKKKGGGISQESVKNWWCKRDANQNYINSYKWKGILRFIVWHEGFIQQIIRTKVIPQND